MKQFTRDEAIAIVKATIDTSPGSAANQALARGPFIKGMRAALEALAAKGVFLHGEEPEETMADRLDAAGIR